MRWGYYDTIFHLLVKPSAFLGVGIGCWRAVGHPRLLMRRRGGAAIAVLWTKMFLQLPGILFLHDVLNGQPGGSRAFKRFLQSIDAKGQAGGNGKAHDEPPRPPVPATVESGPGRERAPPRPLAEVPAGAPTW